MSQFQGYELLTDAERNVFEHLRKVKHESIWNHAIDQVITKGDALRFLRLILQLKSQARDNEEVMKTILEDAYEPLMAL